MNKKRPNHHMWILSTKLLFRPTIRQEVLMEVINKQISKGANPLLSIAYSIDQIMEAHTTQNLEPLLDSLKIAFKTSLDDLHFLRLGYRYIVSTAIFTILSKDMSKENRVQYVASLFEYSENEVVNKIQTEIIKDLQSTINLLKLDNSGALIFQFLLDNSPFENQYFLAGMEIATVLISGLSQEVEKLHPALHWPQPAVDYTLAT